MPTYHLCIINLVIGPLLVRARFDSPRACSLRVIDAIYGHFGSFMQIDANSKLPSVFILRALGSLGFACDPLHYM